MSSFTVRFRFPIRENIINSKNPSVKTYGANTKDNLKNRRWKTALAEGPETRPNRKQLTRCGASWQSVPQRALLAEILCYGVLVDTGDPSEKVRLAVKNMRS